MVMTTVCLSFSKGFGQKCEKIVRIFTHKFFVVDFLDLFQTDIMNSGHGVNSILMGVVKLEGLSGDEWGDVSSGAVHQIFVDDDAISG